MNRPAQNLNFINYSSPVESQRTHNQLIFNKQLLINYKFMLTATRIEAGVIIYANFGYTRSGKLYLPIPLYFPGTGVIKFYRTKHTTHLIQLATC